MKQFLPVALCALAFVSNSYASLVVNVSQPVEVGGAGLGAVNTVLTLQSPGNSSTSTGCVAPQGNGTTTTGCGFADQNVQGQFGTPTLAALGIFSGTDLQIIFNASEPQSDPSITISQLALTLYGTGGSSATFTLPSAVTLNSTFAGIGNAGYLITLDAQQAAQATTFISNNGGRNVIRVGLGSQLTNAQGGQDTFFVRSSAGGFETAIPEPTSMLLLGTGLAAVSLVGRKRRQAR